MPRSGSSVGATGRSESHTPSKPAVSIARAKSSKVDADSQPRSGPTAKRTFIDPCSQSAPEIRDPVELRLLSALRGSLRRASLPSVRHDLLLQLGRVEDASDEFRRAATMMRNECGRLSSCARGGDA
jgi:hypothetical protein